MSVQPDFKPLSENRRYFPDWTRRRLESGPELEADRNSYLAGGYAEEFGYRPLAGGSRGVPVLGDTPPEQCPEWLCQALATHPGYPIRPHPLELEPQELGWLAGQAVGERIPAGERTTSGGGSLGGRFIPVSERAYERSRRDAANRGAAISMRLTAALVSWRWTFWHRWRVHS
ncbi:MAG TPA: hypothetical protein VF193_09250 [Steroidobacter sp.]|jgi:hypothetical protein